MEFNLINGEIPKLSPQNWKDSNTGAANYRRIPGMDQQELLSARIMQKTNLIIMPMVFVSFILGKKIDTEDNLFIQTWYLFL